MANTYETDGYKRLKERIINENLRDRELNQVRKEQNRNQYEANLKMIGARNRLAAAESPVSREQDMANLLDRIAPRSNAVQVPAPPTLRASTDGAPSMAGSPAELSHGPLSRALATQQQMNPNVHLPHPVPPSPEAAASVNALGYQIAANNAVAAREAELAGNPNVAISGPMNDALAMRQRLVDVNDANVNFGGDLAAQQRAQQVQQMRQQMAQQAAARAAAVPVQPTGVTGEQAVALNTAPTAFRTPDTMTPEMRAARVASLREQLAGYTSAAGQAAQEGMRTPQAELERRANAENQRRVAVAEAQNQPRVVGSTAQPKPTLPPETQAKVDAMLARMRAAGTEPEERQKIQDELFRLVDGLPPEQKKSWWNEMIGSALATQEALKLPQPQPPTQTAQPSTPSQPSVTPQKSPDEVYNESLKKFPKVFEYQVDQVPEYTPYVMNGELQVKARRTELGKKEINGLAWDGSGFVLRSGETISFEESRKRGYTK